MESLIIGRIVHFVDYDDSHCPAIVTEVTEGTRCFLTIFRPLLDPYPTTFAVPFDESSVKTLTWHWPENIS